ncbi:MAG: hypothetical protein R2830_17485 [Saprospiraceae bacterium]
MKAQKIYGFFFLLALPFLANAQEAQRSLSPEQLLELQKGGLASFDEYLFRFGAAREDGDLKSMEKLRKELVKIMRRDIHEVQTAHKQAQDKTDFAAMLEAASTGDLAQAPETVEKAFQQFKTWKEENISLTEKELKQKD